MNQTDWRNNFPQEKRYFETKRGILYNSDCLEILKKFPENSIDTIITDPPYGLEFMGKEWDKLDNYQQFTFKWVKEVLRVAKPGTIMLTFGGTRTWHRLTCGLEDAGWIIKDTLMWLYGSSFPKSLNIGKVIIKKLGKERSEWRGYGTALKPAWEPIIMAMKPLDKNYVNNTLKWNVAGLNIDGAKIGNERIIAHHAPKGTFAEGESRKSDTNYYQYIGRFPANILLGEEAAKILGEQSYIRNGISRFFYVAKVSRKEKNMGLENFESQKVNDGRKTPIDNPYQRGETLRYNVYPTIKPLRLLEYFCILTKPPSGRIVLDPFAGSGTTLIVCMKIERKFIGIEKVKEYCKISKARIEFFARQLEFDLI